MHYTKLLILGLLLAWPQDTPDAKQALDLIKKSGGSVTFDEKAPGRPVIGVNL